MWTSESGYHFDGVFGEFNPLLAAQQRQQNEHALVRSLTGVESELPAKRPMRDAHSLAHAKFLALG